MIKPRSEPQTPLQNPRSRAKPLKSLVLGALQDAREVLRSAVADKAIEPG